MPADLLAHVIRPDWPAPAHVHALVTTRRGGVSLPPYDSLNLGDHVSDDPVAVQTNRDRLEAALATLAPAEAPLWLRQVHGTRIVEAPQDAQVRRGTIPEADAAMTTHPGIPLTVMTADCLPAFFTDRQGSRIAVAHAGWRGLCDGILEKTSEHFSASDDVLVWLGPAIGPTTFEVGDEVRAAFMAHDPQAREAFVPIPGRSGHWFGDLYQLARQRLARVGVTAVSGGGRDTLREQDDFFSFRRDARTGRMASVIWLGAQD